MGADCLYRDLINAVADQSTQVDTVQVGDQGEFLKMMVFQTGMMRTDYFKLNNPLSLFGKDKRSPIYKKSKDSQPGNLARRSYNNAYYDNGYYSEYYDAQDYDYEDYYNNGYDG